MAKTNITYTSSDHHLYTISMHFVFVFNSLITAISIYVMKTHTPITMKSYKWFLLNVSLTCYFLDVWMSAFYIPFPILPAIGSCSFGLLRPLGRTATVTSFVVFNWLMGVGGMALTFAMIFRLASVLNKSLILTRKQSVIAMAIVQTLYAMPMAIFAFVINPSKDESSEYIKENFPMLFDFYENNSCSILSFGIPLSYLICAVVSITLVVFFNVGLIVAIFITIHKMRSKMSIRTYKMQKQLAISVMIQFLVPVVLIGISYCGLGMALYFDLDSVEYIAELAFLCSSSHTTANGLVIICGVRPYRDAIVQSTRKYLNLVVGKITGKHFISVVTPAGTDLFGFTSTSTRQPMVIRRSQINITNHREIASISNMQQRRLTAY